MKMPPFVEPEAPAPLSDETRALLHEAFRSGHAYRLKLYSQPHFAGHEPPPPTPEDTVDALLDRLGDPEPWTSLPPSLVVAPHGQAMEDFLGRPDMGVVPTLRFSLSFRKARGLAVVWTDSWVWQRSRRPGASFDLRTIVAALPHCAVDRAVPPGPPSGFGYAAPPEALAPWYAMHPLGLVEALQDHASGWGATGRQDFALRVLGAMGLPPACVREPLWPAAFGKAKGNRRAIQDSLDGAPECAEHLLAALSSKKQHERELAAEWLGRRRDPSTKKRLVGALKLEKKDGPMAALMDALESLGAPLDAFVDREALVAKSERTMAKKGYEDILPWLPWDELPAVAWVDGALVPAKVLRYWVVAAHKTKKPGEAGLLRQYGRRMDPVSADGFGLAVLEAWIGRDTQVRTTIPADARKELERKAKQYESWMTPAKAKEEVEAGYLRAPNTAIADKGMLAVVAGFGGASIAPVVEAYLKKWYGWRAAQCKALMQMLARVEAPNAIQLLLATGTNFRTAGIRKEANAQAEALAERRGWTVEELNDRTVPTAGFDETGRQSFEFETSPAGGRIEVSRRFEARIAPDLCVGLYDEEGAPLKKMPGPRVSEDEAGVKRAMKAFSKAKREVRKVAKMQAGRLYESMCAQRTLSYGELRTYLLDHVIVGSLARRLLFRTGDGQTFRCTADGELVDAAGDDVAIDKDELVGLAHGSTLTTEERAAWLQHLEDWEVLPLFDQLSGSPYGADHAALSMPERRGHVLDAFVLRGAMKKASFTPGPAGDGGYLNDYVRPLTGLGLQVEFGISGLQQPISNCKVALYDISFAPIGGGGALALSAVPQVLLSEMAGLGERVADLGSGFDADWQSLPGR